MPDYFHCWYFAGISPRRLWHYYADIFIDSLSADAFTGHSTAIVDAAFDTPDAYFHWGFRLPIIAAFIFRRHADPFRHYAPFHADTPLPRHIAAFAMITSWGWLAEGLRPAITLRRQPPPLAPLMPYAISWLKRHGFRPWLAMQRWWLSSPLIIIDAIIIIRPLLSWYAILHDDYFRQPPSRYFHASWLLRYY